MSVKKSNDWVTFMRVLDTTKPYKFLFAVSILLALLIAPVSILQPFLVQKMVDNNILGDNKDGLVSTAILFVLALIANVIMKYYFIYVTADLGQSIIKDLRTKVFRHITHLRMRFFDQTPIGTATTRTINDIEAINNVFSQGAITIFADIITLLAVIGIMIHTSWRLTLIVMITMPIMIIATYIFKEKVKVAFQKVRNEIAAMNSFLQERITGIKIVQIFNAEKQEAKKFKDINRKYTSANLDTVFYYAIFFPVVELISAIALALMIWLGAKGYIQDKISFGALVAFPLYLNLMFRPLRFMADKFNTMQMGLVAAERVFKVLDSTDFIPNEGKIHANKLNGKVTFQNLSFAYDDKNYVLENISFDVGAGKMLALVGSTGSGKSTIINLISRFYDFQKGDIFIDDINIREYEILSLRKRMAIVLQDVFLFEGSILDNITLRDKSIDIDVVISASKTIGAHKFIDNLVDKYDTKVSERGSNFSVGQRQLISFVRALVFNPDILILDEATSSIDTESELLIQHAIEKLTEKRTSIIIAHRLSTIRHADQILVLSDGKIIEKGTHDELILNKDGHYKKMHDFQFVEESTIY